MDLPHRWKKRNKLLPNIYFFFSIFIVSLGLLNVDVISCQSVALVGTTGGDGGTELKEINEKKMVFGDNRPSASEYAFLSSHVYHREGERDNGEWSELEKKGWRIHSESSKAASGYFGRIYIKETTRQIVVVHRGTDDLRIVLENIWGLVFGQNNQIIGQREDAFELVKSSLDYLLDNDDYHQLSFTGHSLGGFLAELSILYSYIEFNKLKTNATKNVGFHALTFESPGCLSTWKKLEASVLTKEIPRLSKLDITGYLSYPNAINTLDKRIGTLYSIRPNIEFTEEFVNNHKPSYWIFKYINPIRGWNFLKRKLTGFKEMAEMVDITYGLSKYSQSALNIEVSDLYTVKSHSMDKILEWFREFDISQASDPSLMLDWPLGLQYPSFADYLSKSNGGKFELSDKGISDILEKHKKEFKKNYTKHFVGVTQPYSLTLPLRHFTPAVQMWLEGFHASKIVLRSDKLPQELKDYLRELHIECIEAADQKFVQLKTKDIRKFRVYISDWLEKNGGDESIYYHVNIDKRIYFEVASSSLYFVGRDAEMKIIHEYWQRSHNNKLLSFMSIVGFGGIGKTELAKNYARKFNEEVNGHVIWINAETNQTISDSFYRLSNKLGIPLRDASDREKSVTTLTTEVYAKILRTYMNTLYIFDNIRNYDSPFLKVLFECVNSLPPSVATKPFVILTSRYTPSGKLFGDSTEEVKLSVLREEHAQEFLIKSLNIVNEESTLRFAQNLAKRLEYFPLSLQQAAAYIDDQRERNFLETTLEFEIEKYLELIENQGRKMLENPVPLLQQDVSRTAFLSWKVTLDKIGEMPEVGLKARELMYTIAFLAPDHIDTNFVTSVNPNNLIDSVFGVQSSNHGHDQVGETLYAINSLFSSFMSLFSSEEDEMRHRDDIFQVLYDYYMCHIVAHGNDRIHVISVHRLMQEIIRVELAVENQLVVNLDRLLNNIREKLLENFWTFPAQELAHVINVWRHAIKYSNDLIHKYDDLPFHIAYKYYVTGRFGEMHEFVVETIALMESANWGKAQLNHLKQLDGQALAGMGEFENALNLLSKVYLDDEKNLNSAQIIGNILRKQKNYQEALRWFEKVLGQRPDEFTEKYFEALKLQEEGQWSESLELFMQLLQSHMSFRFPSKLTVLENIGMIKFHLKRYEESFCFFKDVVIPFARKVEGGDYPELLDNQLVVGRTLKEMGRCREASEILGHVHEQQKRSLGPHHPHTISTKHSLENCSKKDESRWTSCEEWEAPPKLEMGHMKFAYRFTEGPLVHNYNPYNNDQDNALAFPLFNLVAFKLSVVFIVTFLFFAYKKKKLT